MTTHVVVSHAVEWAGKGIAEEKYGSSRRVAGTDGSRVSVFGFLVLAMLAILSEQHFAVVFFLSSFFSIS